MAALAEALASLTLENERLGVLEGRGPVETVTERLGHQGSQRDIVPTFALVYVEEGVDALLLLDALLEHTGGAALDELIVDDVVGERAALHLPGFGLVHGESPVFQEF